MRQQQRGAALRRQGKRLALLMERRVLATQAPQFELEFFDCFGREHAVGEGQGFIALLEVAPDKILQTLRQKIAVYRTSGKPVKIPRDTEPDAIAWPRKMPLMPPALAPAITSTSTRSLSPNSCSISCSSTR